MDSTAQKMDPAYDTRLDLCNASDDLTDQEKVAELLPISVQQLYVVSKLGKTEEAERLASDIALEE